MQRTINIITNHIFWQIGFNDKVYLRSKYWWNNVGVLPIELTKFKDIKRNDTMGWDRKKIMVAYNKKTSNQILATSFFF